MYKPNIGKVLRPLAKLSLLLSVALFASASSISRAREAVKIATVHFGPKLGEVAENRARLVALTEEAARNGAKIIVHTEMATSGYAFFSRADIAKVAEPIEGPTALAIGAVAKRYGAYVVVGLPTIEPLTGQFFNSAILIGPSGKVVGTYNKRSTLLEASYNSVAAGQIPVFQTPYGRVAIVICADLFYSHIPRLAAVGGAEILLVPANVGIDLDLLKVRAFENDFVVVVANRYGTEGRGNQQVSFDQETYAIPSPFPYDFSYGSRSAIVASNGVVLSDFTEGKDAINYANLPKKEEHVFPVFRRPDLYALIGNDTLEPYTLSQSGAPKPVEFAAAAVDPGVAHRDVAGTRAAIEAAITAARGKGWKLRLVVLPIGLFDTMGKDVIQEFSKIVDAEGVDIVVPFSHESASRTVPVSIVIAAKAGQTHDTYYYRRTHRMRNESVALSDQYLVINRDYGRIAPLQGPDLVAPETSIMMAKMGVDVIALSANSGDSLMMPLWRSRTGDYLHVVLANGQGPEAIHLGGYQAVPSQQEGEGLALMLLNTAHVRNKKEPRNLEVSPLLWKCTNDIC
jgi:predicted amidohydrolase